MSEVLINACRVLRLRTMTLLVVWSFVTVSAGAGVGLSVAFDYGSYVLGEPVNGVVSIVNRSSAPIVVDDYGDHIQNQIFFEIQTGNPRRRLGGLHDGSVVRSLLLPPGDRESISVNLSRHYPLGQPGRYYARARLRTRAGEYESDLQMFDVVPGLLLAEATTPIPDRPGETRNFRVVYWSRVRREWIFLRAEDSPSGAIWETLLLGPLVRTTPVTLTADPQGFLSVRHQATRDMYVESHVESRPRGLRLVRQSTMEDTSTTPLRRAFLEGSPPPSSPEPELRRRWRPFRRR